MQHHIIKSLAAIAMVLLSLGTVEAQDNMVTLRGTVTDLKTKEVVPYATVYSENRIHYTTTNADGVYVLKLPVTMKDSRMVFSQMGYRRDTVDVSILMKNGDVKLASGSIELREVTVSEYRSVKSLLKEVIRRIPENYHTDTMVCTGFFRRAATVNDSLYLFEEHVADMLRVGYGKNPQKSYSNPRGINSNYMAIRKLRIMDYDTMMLYRMVNSPWTVQYLSEYMDGYLLRDKVEIYKSYLEKVPRKATLKEFTDGDGTAYYVISMGRSAITIEKQSLAIVRIDRHSSMGGTPITIPVTWLVKGFKKMSPLRKFDISTDETYIYGKVGDRYTLLSYNTVETTYYVNDTKGQWEGVVPEMMVKDYTTFQLVGHRPGHWSFIQENGIDPYRATYQPYDKLPVSHKAYSDDYWEQYNYIPINADLLKKLNAKRSAGKE